MKRAFPLLIAALFVLLACPSTHSEAVFDSTVDSGPIISTKPGLDEPAGTEDEDADGDDGDADGLSGYRTKHGFTGALTTNGVDLREMTVKLWWNLFFWYR